MRLQTNSNSHKVLAYLYGKDSGMATAKQIVTDVDAWAFGTVHSKGPMGTLMSNHYVVRVSRGLYQITVGGMQALKELDKQCEDNGLVNLTQEND